jgi:hypothetical protein
MTQVSITDLTRTTKREASPIHFDSAKKPWKKGGGDSGQMAYLTKELEKHKKKLKKSKKAAKKRAHD